MAVTAICAASAASAASTTQTVYSGDLIVLGNACIGYDCYSTPVSNPLVLTENNTRIAFGMNDPIRMTANESANGGASGFFFDMSRSGTFDAAPVQVSSIVKGTVETDGRLKIAAADYGKLTTLSGYDPGGMDAKVTLNDNPLGAYDYIYLPQGSYAGTGPYYSVPNFVTAQDAAGNPVTAGGTYSTHTPFVGFTSNGVTLGQGAAVVDGQVSVGSSTSKRKLTNAADGTQASDAITVGQLSAFTSGAQQQSVQIDRLNDQVTSMSAMSVAMSAMKANPRGNGGPSFSIGLGQYGGVSAMAAGVIVPVTSHVNYRVGFADSSRSAAQITFGGSVQW